MLEDVEQATAIGTQRVIALEGGRNFRDLGGYETIDGRRVKWGVVFRSGSLAGLTAADWQSLLQRGVRSMCDLRTTHECASEPFAWKDAATLSYFSRDYQSSFGELRKVMASDLATGDAARAAMMTGYRELPFEQADAYRQIFLSIASNAVPLIFNCSAGKDRAGTAAALILSALGVHKETVIADYILTNTVVNLHKVLGDGLDKHSMLSKLPPEVTTAILGADPAYITNALDSIHERHGSIEEYLRVVLSISDAQLAAIKNNLLEKVR
jgi:protein-tyrosine phosphatase